MRVISGSARGRKLIAPPGLDTRPTTDRVKESVFNIISPYLPADMVLDLFSGSGALGIEALSRGCVHGVFVENQKPALDATMQNISLARVSDRAEVVRGGIATDQISSRTMESKLRRGLFFAGEVIDIAGDLGGFNLHWAWASGTIAGENA